MYIPRRKDTVKKLTETIIALRDEREWKQFHRPKHLVISISLESAALLSVFNGKMNLK